jgi:hypothetical protein
VQYTRERLRGKARRLEHQPGILRGVACRASQRGRAVKRCIRERFTDVQKTGD